MIKKKILLLAPYPIANPQHGGQKRTKAFYDFYESTFREAKFIGIFHKAEGFYTEHSSEDIHLAQPEIIRKIYKQIFEVEMIIGQALVEDPHVKAQLAAALRNFRPDIIHVEQVFLYRGLAPLLEELDLDPKVIFSSQNIEYRMKKKIFETLKLDPKLTRPILKEIKDLETKFSREADLVIAVSELDEHTHREMGARECVIVPNGIEKVKSTALSRQKWAYLRKKTKAGTIGLFVGSAHPPNWRGFLDVIGTDLTFLPKDFKLVIAGGVAEFFEGTYAKGKNKKFWDRVVAIGKISEDDLAGLLDSVDIIVLPITIGGGSNLKTAEAILSRKKIVATNFAFRSFEKYKNLPNIFITDKPDRFKKNMVKAIRSNEIRLTVRDIELSEHVKWEYCLEPLRPKVIALSRLRPRDITKKSVHLVKRVIRGLIRRSSLKLKVMNTKMRSKVDKDEASK